MLHRLSGIGARMVTGKMGEAITADKGLGISFKKGSEVLERAGVQLKRKNMCQKGGKNGSSPP